jgi:hypothetical protein
MTEREHLRHLRDAFEKAGHHMEIISDTGMHKRNSKPYDAIIALKNRGGFCFVEAKIGNRDLKDEQFQFQIDCQEKGIPAFILWIETKHSMFTIDKVVDDTMLMQCVANDYKELVKQFEIIIREEMKHV